MFPGEMSPEVSIAIATSGGFRPPSGKSHAVPNLARLSSQSQRKLPKSRRIRI